VKRGPFIALALASVPWSAAAAPPTLDSVFPPGGKPGAEIDLTLSGKFEPWPCALWFSEKGFTFTPDPKKPGAGKLKIDGSVPAGPVLVRAHNPEGATAPLLFIVGNQTELIEEEKDNSTLSAAAALDRAKLPFVVNGTLSTGGELDAYRIALEKGETLHVRVEAYGLRSMVDPAIHLHDPSGHRLALVHDGPSNLDPVLSFTAESKGDYVISLAGFSHPPAASVAYTGAKNAHYRLSLALKREQIPARLLPADPGPDAAAPDLVPGKPLAATLKDKGKPNRHPVKVKKGDKLLVRVEGRSLGFPIDPVLRILKPDGSEIRKEDDSNKTSDPEYLWTAAEDGQFTLEVSDRFGRAGSEMRYRLSAGPTTPDFTVTMDKAQYAMERGKPVELKATVARLLGHTGELSLSLSGLPAGIALKEPVKIAEKGTEAVLKLEAKADAPGFSGPIRVIAKETKAGKPLEKTAAFSFKDDNQRGPYALDEVKDLWLTLPPPKEEKKPEPKPDEKKAEAKKPEEKKAEAKKK
jgi:hypothetical protein